MKTDRGLQKCIKSGTLLYPNGVVFEGEFDKDYVLPQGNGKLKLYKGYIKVQFLKVNFMNMIMFMNEVLMVTFTFSVSDLLTMGQKWENNFQGCLMPMECRKKEL